MADPKIYKNLESGKGGISKYGRCIGYSLNSTMQYTDGTL